MSEVKEKSSGLALLREPFPPDQIGKLPRYTGQEDKPKKTFCKICKTYHAEPSMHLDFVGHAATTNRLLEADPNWNWEPLAFHDGLPKLDAHGGLWIKLTICGVTRLGYGNAQASNYKDIGTREKEIIGDAIRNAAMRFGVALDLWHKGDVPLNKDDQDADDGNKTPTNKDVPPSSFDVNAIEPQDRNHYLATATALKVGKVVPFGSNRDKDFSEVPLAQLTSALKWAKDKGKFKEFVADAEAFLKKVTMTPLGGLPNHAAPNDDNIPF